MTATVVVTSFRRPGPLAECLAGVRAQHRPPDELLVVLHADDELTPPTLDADLRVVTVTRAGSVAALNAGLTHASGDIVAYIDDDAVPAPDWLERILATFASDPRIAAVGGRDVVHARDRILGREDQGVLGRRRGAPRVGRIQWFGRHVGNHHIGEGAARDVDVLKGANMAFRRAAVLDHGFDTRLRGRGAQTHSELSVCLPLRRRGLRLVYDPAILVDHYPAQRPAGDDREDRALEAVYDWTYNETLQVLTVVTGPRRLAYAVWGLLMGTRGSPGLGTVLRVGLGQWTHFTTAQRARLAAYRTYRTTVRPALTPTVEPQTTSVVVTTYRRTRTLGPCLEALRAQTRAPDEVIVVVHASDEESAPFVDALAAGWPQLRRATVHPPGLVAALNHGLASATQDLVAFVDDDAIPAPDWLERLAAAYERDRAVAAVGGRDVIHQHGRIRVRGDEGITVRHFTTPTVGRISWFGRHLGNHHIGTGSERDVDVLKGVNMSFRRRDVIDHGFDERLRGRGVEIHSELSICLPLRRRGLRLVYDPAIVVDHHPQTRGFGDEREDVSPESIRDATHNETLQLLDFFPPGRRIVLTAWGTAVGSSDAPGLMLFAHHLVTGVPAPWTRFTAAQAGRIEAWRTHRTDRPSHAP